MHTFKPHRIQIVKMQERGYTIAHLNIASTKYRTLPISQHGMVDGLRIYHVNTPLLGTSIA